jgi:hypothetical protein
MKIGQQHADPGTSSGPRSGYGKGQCSVLGLVIICTDPDPTLNPAAKPDPFINMQKKLEKN